MVYEADAMLDWLITCVRKLDVVDTCKLYELASLEGFQVSVALGEISTASLAGQTSAGTGGTAMMVVNEKGSDQSLVPPSFTDSTRQ